MPTRTIRARVHAGRIEPIEELDLPEGAEVTVAIEVPTPPSRSRPRFAVWDLGAPFPLTRWEIYDDIW